MWSFVGGHNRLHQWNASIFSVRNEIGWQQHRLVSHTSNLTGLCSTDIRLGCRSQSGAESTSTAWWWNGKIQPAFLDHCSYLLSGPHRNCQNTYFLFTNKSPKECLHMFVSKLIWLRTRLRICYGAYKQKDTYINVCMLPAEEMPGWHRAGIYRMSFLNSSNFILQCVSALWNRSKTFISASQDEIVWKYLFSDWKD